MELFQRSIKIIQDYQKFVKMIQEVGEYLIEKRVTDQVKLKSNFGQIVLNLKWKEIWIIKKCQFSTVPKMQQVNNRDSKCEIFQ